MPDKRKFPNRKQKRRGAPDPYKAPFWRKLAAEYLALQAEGYRDVPRRLALKYGKEGSTMRGLIRRCEGKGYLSRPEPVVPAGAVVGAKPDRPFLDFLYTPQDTAMSATKNRGRKIRLRRS